MHGTRRHPIDAGNARRRSNRTRQRKIYSMKVTPRTTLHVSTLILRDFTLLIVSNNIHHINLIIFINIFIKYHSKLGLKKLFLSFHKKNNIFIKFKIILNNN